MQGQLPQLVSNLQSTVRVLQKTKHYEWGHSGACNCGHLAQVMTGLPSQQIHRVALKKEGDWTEKAAVYCENSGYEIDNVISIMLRNGLRLNDIKEIEYLSNPRVLRHLGVAAMKRNSREEVIRYFEAWIEVLEADIANEKVVWESRLPEDKLEQAEYDTVPDEFRKSRRQVG